VWFDKHIESKLLDILLLASDVPTTSFNSKINVAQLKELSARALVSITNKHDTMAFARNLSTKYQAVPKLLAAYLKLGSASTITIASIKDSYQRVILALCSNFAAHDAILNDETSVNLLVQLLDSPVRSNYKLGLLCTRCLHAVEILSLDYNFETLTGSNLALMTTMLAQSDKLEANIKPSEEFKSLHGLVTLGPNTFEAKFSGLLDVKSFISEMKMHHTKVKEEVAKKKLLSDQNSQAMQKSRLAALKNLTAEEYFSVFRSTVVMTGASLFYFTLMWNVSYPVRPKVRFYFFLFCYIVVSVDEKNALKLYCVLQL